MIVVLDTNVVVSALITPGGVCARILDQLADGHFAACVSQEILREYTQVLNRPRFNVEPADAVSAMDMFFRVPSNGVNLTQPAGLPDPDDEVFLALARAEKVDYLVTGNQRHFPPRLCKGVHVISPADFLKLLHS